jgi:hypothetical protein
MRRSSLVVLLVIALAGCGGEDAETVAGSGYEYEVPEGWKDSTHDERLSDIGIAGYNFDTIVTGQVEEAFATNVNVIVEGSIAPGVSAREYVDASVRTLRNPELLQGEARRLISRLHPRDLTASRRIELDGEEAYATDYTGNEGARVLRFRSVVAVRNGRAYAITYTALRHLFRAHADEVDQILDSWAWR